MRRQWTFRLLAAAAVVSLAGLMAPPAMADDPAAELKRLEEKQQQIQSEKQNAKSALERIYWQAEETRLNIRTAEADLAQANGRVTVASAQLEATHQELEHLRADLAKTQQDFDLQKGRFAGRLRALHERGRVSYLAVLLGSESFSQFISRMDVMRAIVKRDNEILGEIRTVRTKLDTQRQAVAKREESFAALELQEKAYRETAQARLLELQSLNDALAQQTAELQDLVAEYERQAEAVEQEIYQAQLALKRAAGRFAPIKPLKGNPPITSYFGWRTDPWPSNHGGVDFGAASGTAIYAVEDGVVVYVGWDSVYGNRVVLDHGGGIASWYAHASTILVNTADTVKQGQAIARVGSTGLSTGPHLHLEIRIDNVKQDPLQYIGE
ncbi:MAG TPA: peptidoglycan DD-metalloendopeptidase family protein [Symbiobacteriaceae bacterium]|nr:peptidoglycan DD-metalloendopeptidase family protein [Symbiobacteriaceae bacterium]